VSTSKRKAALHPPVVSIGDDIVLGPGKIEILRKLGEGHSISSAARELGMTYKRAWALIDTLNKGFGQPVVETVSGGRGGGGANLTPLGQELVVRYLELEQKLALAAEADLQALEQLCDRSLRS